MKKWTEAEAQLKKAIAADRDNAVAHNNMGVVLSQEGQLGKALKEFETALSLDPNYHKASQNLLDTKKLIEKKNKKTAKRTKKSH